MGLIWHRNFFIGLGSKLLAGQGLSPVPMIHNGKLGKSKLGKLLFFMFQGGFKL